jgi:hypothetical protein
MSEFDEDAGRAASPRGCRPCGSAATAGRSP